MSFRSYVPIHRLLVMSALLPAVAAAQIEPAGAPFELSQTRGIIDSARVAVATDGTTLVAWSLCVRESGVGDCSPRIVVRLFDELGQPLSDELTVVESTDRGVHLEEIVASTAGSFLVTWSTQATQGVQLLARSLAPDASPLGEAVVLKTAKRDEVVGSDSNQQIALAAAPDGTFVAIWDATGRTSSRIQALRLSAEGVPIGQPFRVSARAPGRFMSPDAAFTPQGELIAIWVRAVLLPGRVEQHLEARRLAGGGEALSGNLTLDDLTLRQQKRSPRVVALAGGDFVVTWLNDARNVEVVGRRFDRRARAVGGRLTLHTTEGHRSPPWPFGWTESRAGIVWNSLTVGDPTGIDLRARVLEPKGRASGNDVNLTPEGFGNQSDARGAVGPSGRALVVWVEEGGDAIRRSVFGRLLELGPPVPAWPDRPNGLRAEALSGSEARLTWSDNSLDEGGFEVQGRAGKSGWTSMATTEADADEQLLDDLTPGTRYRFRVRAIGPSGASGWSNRTSVSLPPEEI